MSKRSVFEEVGGAKRAEAARVVAREPARGAIALWLWLLAALVAAMVLVGGATRLTDSGLSITEWAPVMGALPPMSDADWQAAFDAYKGTTEFQEQNASMTLAEFRPIFWWEWGHRLLGRLVGVVWLAGLVWFLARRAVPAGWTGRLVLPGVLGGVQGAVGWWMVASGLSGRLDVAPYRLAVHLGLAFAIFALLAWLALKVRQDEVAALQARRRRVGALMGWSGALVALVFVQLLSGALVAGLDAGRGFIDWPLMEGAFFPESGLDMAPVWVNVFENPGLAQFDHRMIAYALLVAAGLFVWRANGTGLVAVRRWCQWAGVAILGQALLGVVTVMHASPLALALMHQAGALVVVLALVRARFEIAYPGAQRLSA